MPPETQTEMQAVARGGDVLSAWGLGNIPVTRPPAATYTAWRAMTRHPVVALCLAVAKLPVLMASYTFTGEPEDRRLWLEEHMKPLWRALLRDSLRAVELGWSGFEKVWGMIGPNEAPMRLGYTRLKALVPDKTEIRLGAKGEFAGLKQKAVELRPEESWLFTYDRHYDDMYGRSRLENIRETAWTNWMAIANRSQQYATKVAGVIPMIHYPPGESKDKTGQERSNFAIAETIMRNLSKGHGVAMPNELSDYGRDLLTGGGGATKDMLRAWVIDFLEAGTAHGEEFVNMLRYWDSQMARGLLVLERAVLEGQHGTKAEAGEHGDVTRAIGHQTQLDFVEQANAGLIDPLLVVNWGPKAAGTVRIETEPIDPERATFIRSLISKVLATAGTADMVDTLVDWRGALDQAEVPLVEGGGTAGAVTSGEGGEGAGRRVAKALEGQPER